MDCPLQTVHMCLLKGILGVKRTTPNWSVLHECGQDPLHSIGSERLQDFIMLCYAATVALLPKFSRLILR